MRFIINILCISLTLGLAAQEKKIEKESKLKNKDVAAKLEQILAEYLKQARKVNFYLEENGDKKSYEAKFEFKDSFYSIEFDDSLRLEDVEVIVRKKQISSPVMDNIKRYLSTYDKSKIDKIQRQFSSNQLTDEKVIQMALNEGTGDVIRYEIEVNVKSDGDWLLLELLFSSDGEFISQKEIIKRSSDFILY